MGEKNVLVFHPAIAPYRVDFFNELYDRLGAKIVFYYDMPRSQDFDKDLINSGLHFAPEHFALGGRVMGHNIYPGYSIRIEKEKPDIVICSEFDAGLISAIMYRKLAKKDYSIFTICDDSLEIAASCNGVRNLSRSFALQKIDGLILSNDKAATYYNEMYGSNSYVFPIIPSAKSFYRDKEEAVELAGQYIREYELTGRRVFLYVGRIAKEKNLEYMIDSFARDHVKHGENILFIIGDDLKETPGYRQRLEKRVEELEAGEYIRFLGRKEGLELKAWYYLGQCLVLPSYCERFGAVVGEALLAGERVLVSSSAGSAVLVKKSVLKGNGFEFDLNEESIDFDRIAYKVPVTEKDWKVKESRMFMDFDKLMDGLCEWLLCTHR